MICNHLTRIYFFFKWLKLCKNSEVNLPLHNPHLQLYDSLKIQLVYNQSHWVNSQWNGFKPLQQALVSVNLHYPAHLSAPQKHPLCQTCCVACLGSLSIWKALITGHLSKKRKKWVVIVQIICAWCCKTSCKKKKEVAKNHKCKSGGSGSCRGF